MNKANFKEKYQLILDMIKKSRDRYISNSDVIDELKKMLSECTGEKRELVKSSLDLVMKEQEDLIKQQRTNMYRLAAMDNVASLMNKTKVDKNNNVVYDKSDVTITEVKEDTHVKVINITGEEDKKADDVTEVLKKETVSEEQLKDAKIVFDGKYKLVYNDGKGVYEKKSNDLLLDLSLEKKKNTQNSVISNMLINFDLDNNTNLKEKYASGLLDVNYYFDKANKELDKDTIRKTKKIAKKEARNFDRVKIFDNSFKKVRTGIAFVATAALMVIGSTGISKLFNKNKTTDSYNSIETVCNAGESDATYEAVRLENSSMITSIPDLDLEKSKEETVELTEKVNDEENKTVEIKEEESTKIGSLYSFDSLDLYRASTDSEPVGNTINIQKDHEYIPTLLSVVYKNQVIMKLSWSDSMDIDYLENTCKEKYGNDINIFINFNELDKEGNLVTENIGWALKEQVLSKGKVLK